MYRKIEITPELEAKVIRLYTQKGLSLNLITKLACPRDIAKEILIKNGIELKSSAAGIRNSSFNTDGVFPTSWKEHIDKKDA
jgi:hypothetical protein